ncbi:MAG: HlyC/CorC family transporter [Acidobacteria bacterium]|nr:HlyC/CorC family transporter [Acidobacteriota bacterium]
MNGLAAWLSHPVTLGLAGLVLMLLFSVIELLLRALAELGNVRFQGILEEHPGLFGGEIGVHVSRLIDVLRWLQLACIGLLWLVVFRFPELDGWRAVAVSAALPVVLMVLVRTVIGSLSEDAVGLLMRLMRPLAAPLVRLSPVSKVALADEEEEEASEAEIQAYLEAGEAAGIFEGVEGEYVESLVDFFDTVVREVMTPRTEMVAVADTDSYRELLEVFAETHKSRIPVYHETVDRIIGVVHVKNLVKHLLRGAEPSVAELARKCPVVPEGKALGELLSDFQQQHQQMAIVVDEYGGTSGLVTLEDILEEIVGEIQDEHDPKQPPEWQELSPGVYRLQGRAPLEVLEELFAVEVEEEDMDTVGGLVFSRYGTVPEPNTEVEDPGHGLRFMVEEMDERRIVSVTVQRIDGSEKEE